jgi:hypothetical protein
MTTPWVRFVAHAMAYCGTFPHFPPENAVFVSLRLGSIGFVSSDPNLHDPLEASNDSIARNAIAPVAPNSRPGGRLGRWASPTRF